MVSAKISSHTQEAQREIASIVIDKSLAGQLHWEVTDRFFACDVADEIMAYLHFRGEPGSTDQWEKFEIEQGSKTLVRYVYPSKLNEAFGYAVDPLMKRRLDELYATLSRGIFDQTYGKALNRLRKL